MLQYRSPLVIMALLPSDPLLSTLHAYSATTISHYSPLLAPAHFMHHIFRCFRVCSMHTCVRADVKLIKLFENKLGKRPAHILRWHTHPSLYIFILNALFSNAQRFWMCVCVYGVGCDTTFIYSNIMWWYLFSGNG